MRAMHTFAESISRRNLKRDETDETFTRRQLLALDCLVDRRPDETLTEVGKRAGISRVTLYRYLNDPEFHREYRARVAAELTSQRSRMANALIKGGVTPGPGQASLQKIYWTMLGELRDTLEVTGKDGGPIDINVQPIPLDKLSPEGLTKILAILEDELGAGFAGEGARLIGSGATDAIDVEPAEPEESHSTFWGLQTVKTQIDDRSQK